MRAQFQFSEVSRVPRDEWPGSLLRNDSPPGTIFLLGDWGVTGGFLKMTRQGQLLLLTRAEVFGRTPARWPHSEATLSIEGDRAVFDVPA